MTRIPATPADLVAYWRRTGYQHFHLNTVPGGGQNSHTGRPYVTWTPVFRVQTKRCEDAARCLILRVASTGP